MIKTFSGVLLLLLSAKFAASQNMITNTDTVITGPITVAHLGQFQWYADGFASFTPDAEKVKQISQQRSKTMKITIIGGSWCEDTQKHLPSFMKTLKAANWPDDAISIYFLDRDKKSADGTEQKYGISLVPTFILTNKEVERGRIIEHYSISPETDLLMMMVVK